MWRQKIREVDYLKQCGSAGKTAPYTHSDNLFRAVQIAEGFLFYTPISAARSRAASMLGAKLSSPTRPYMPDF